MKIKDMCDVERPREKLLRRGAEALSDGELLAIFIVSGTAGCSALESAQRLLVEAGGSLAALAGMDRKRLMSVPGVAEGRAATLLAAFELGRRFVGEAYRYERTAITSPKQVYLHMIPSLKGLDHEECWVMLLNKSRFVIDTVRASVGAEDATLIDSRIIVRLALDRRAAHVVLVHNHPSGNPVPSMADIRETESLKEALGTCGLCLMDHVVICDDCFYSFDSEETAISPFSSSP